MIKIVTDSASLYSKEKAKQLGIELAPLSVTIDGKSFRDFEEIETPNLIKRIKEEGAIPTSSQPSIGEKTDIYNELIAQGHEIIDIAMADGLSGTYQSACMAKEACDDPDKVTVFNTKTLCVPEQLMVNKAKQMADNGQCKEDILAMLEKASNSDISFLIPLDFDFLVRGGRTNNATGIIGGLLKLIPVVQKNEEGKRLDKFCITRTYKKAIHNMISHFKEKGVDSSYTFGIGHGMNEELANQAKAALEKEFEGSKVYVELLTPSFVTQGGPGCVSVQAIKI